MVRNLELLGLLKVSGCVTSVNIVCSAFLDLAREERAVAFLRSCALFPGVSRPGGCDCLAEAFLFVFFDSDTVDLYRGSIGIVGVTRRNGHEHIQSFHNLTENSMPVIQMGSGSMCDEKL